MTYQEQLDLWVAGESVHGDQCCPDFSCCKPELRADADVRRAFAAASESERYAFLGVFLSAAMALAASEHDDPPSVHIAGRGEPS